MNLLEESWQYIQENQERFLEALRVHIELSVYSLLLAMVIFLPLGVIASRSAKTGPLLVGLVSAARVVPSIAVLSCFIPIGRRLASWRLSGQYRSRLRSWR